MGPLIRRGDHAARSGNWTEAASCYRKILKLQPQNADIWVQYGHALKECGTLAEARNAYAKAVEAAPDSVDARLQLGRIQSGLGDKDAALANFADALRADPSCIEAYEALVSAGARNLVPDGFIRNRSTDVLAELATLFVETRRKLDELDEVSTYPIRLHDAFRRAYPIKPPPSNPTLQFRIVVDAYGSSPSFLQSTVLSLLDQSYTKWTAEILADRLILDHPVASLGCGDPRLDFREASLPDSQSSYSLFLSAGTYLDPEALAWFAFTADHTGCAGAWCDYDHATQHWRSGLKFELPIFWGMFDADLMLQSRFIPALVMVRDTVAAVSSNETGPEYRRRLLMKASQHGGMAHIPRILASVTRVPERAEHAPAGQEEIKRWSLNPLGNPPRSGPSYREGTKLVERESRPNIAVSSVCEAGEHIHVIIQTRDEPDMLATAIESLLTKAADKSRVEISVVDNRSKLDETTSLLDQLSRSGAVRVITLDQPFNWSHANNVAARHSDSKNLIFANNDIEMATHGWDELMLGYLQRPDVGAVGVRLLYPDGRIQHAGVLLGLGEGGPIHDGLDEEASNRGPLDRFDLTRSVAAVTGAFMGIRRALFDQLGGFDAARLPVGYNDIDLCLKIRAAGLHILYTPAIELVHHESKTRGRNDTRARVAWEQGERATMYRKWGDAMMLDPSYNPHWPRSRAYDGLRNPTMREVVEHIQASARANPWDLPAQLADPPA